MEYVQKGVEVVASIKRSKDHIFTLKVLMLVDVFYSIFCATVLKGIIPPLIMIISFFIINYGIPYESMIYEINSHNKRMGLHLCRVPSISGNGTWLCFGVYLLTMGIVKISSIINEISVSSIAIGFFIILFSVITIQEQINVFKNMK